MIARGGEGMGSHTRAAFHGGFAMRPASRMGTDGGWSKVQSGTWGRTASVPIRRFYFRPMHFLEG